MELIDTGIDVEKMPKEPPKKRAKYCTSPRKPMATGSLTGMYRTSFSYTYTIKNVCSEGDKMQFVTNPIKEGINSLREWELKIWAQKMPDSDETLLLSAFVLTKSDPELVTDWKKITAKAYIVDERGFVKANSKPFKGGKPTGGNPETIFYNFGNIDNIINSHAINGTLRISLEVAMKEQDLGNDAKAVVPFMDDLGSMLDSGEFSDFKVICWRRTFKCHKVILASRSNYFKAQDEGIGGRESNC